MFLSAGREGAPSDEQPTQECVFCSQFFICDSPYFDRERGAV